MREPINGISIPVFTNEEIQQIIDKTDPAELRLMFLSYEKMPINQVAKLLHQTDKIKGKSYYQHLLHVTKSVKAPYKDLAYMYNALNMHPSVDYIIRAFVSQELYQQMQVFIRLDNESLVSQAHRIVKTNDTAVMSVFYAAIRDLLNHPASKALKRQYRQALTIIKAKQV